MDGPQNHYTFLGLDPSSDRETIEAAVERLRKQANSLAYTNPTRSQALHEQIRLVREDLLSGENVRAAYDDALFHPEHARHDEDVTAGEEQPLTPELTGLVRGDWEAQRPPPAIIAEVRSIARQFYRAETWYRQQETGAGMSGRVAESVLGRQADGQAEEQRAIVTRARTEAGERLTRLGLQDLLTADTEATSGVETRPLSDSAAQAQAAAATIARTSGNPLIRTPGWLIWLLALVVAAAGLGAVVALNAGRSAALAVGAAVLVLVVLITLLRAMQWNRLLGAGHTLARAVRSAETLPVQKASAEPSGQPALLTEERRALDETMAQLRAATDRVWNELGMMGAPWTDPVWERWAAPAQAGPLVRFGSLEARSGERTLVLPALAAYPGPSSFLLRGRSSAALAVVQSLALRIAAATPPGVLHLSIVTIPEMGAITEPGEREARRAGADLWDSPAAVEHGLEALARSIRTIAQARLRGEPAPAEEYRLLVVAGIPTTLSEAGAHYLTEIMAVGPVCGVYTLLVLDPSRPLPPGLNPIELERGAVVIRLEGDEATWDDPDFRTCRLDLDSLALVPPDLGQRVLGAGATALVRPFGP